MHDAAFVAAGIDARYELMEIGPDAVEGVIAEARGPDWLGLQVTAPYKRVVANLCDRVEADAATIGAVNSVARTAAGELVGFNTDAPGFRAAVELALGRTLLGVDVVVAGAGGAAHAVVFACLDAGARQVTIGNRTASTATELKERLAGVGAEMAVGMAMAQQMMNQPGGIMGAQATPGIAGPAPAPTASDLMTPAQVAQMLGVAEADVMASLDSGDLKGKKIGSQWRVTKTAVDQFLHS